MSGADPNEKDNLPEEEMAAETAGAAGAGDQPSKGEAQSVENAAQSNAPEQTTAGGPEPDSSPAPSVQQAAKVDSSGHPFDEMAAAPPPMPAGAAPLELPDFSRRLDSTSGQGIDLLHDVELNVKIELGRAEMLIEDVLRLGEGSVVELDKLAGDPVDVFVNERLVARGEVIVLNENFCVRVSEIVAGIGEEQAA